MNATSRRSKFAGFALIGAVLVVSLCAARCVAVAASMPCHGEASSQQGPCASLSSQAWLVTPDATASVLALLLLAFFVSSFPGVAALSPVLPASAFSFAADIPPPRRRRISGVAPRAPPRRR